MHSRIGVIGIFFLLMGCTGPGRPTDSTPPTVDWIVTRVSDGNQSTFAANANGVANWGESWRITLRAKDPEGVQSMDIGGSLQWKCLAGEVGTDQQPVIPGASETFKPTSDGTVLTEFPLMLEVSSRLNCPDGYSFPGGSITMTGHASNYHGGTSSGMLTLRVPYDCTNYLETGERC